MDSDRVDVEGDWYGVLVHSPSRAVIHVRFGGESGTFQGKWDCPDLTRGAGKTGTFSATRFLRWLHVRMKTPPLAGIQCRLTVLTHKGQSMITGVIPLEEVEIPFATVTLFRGQEMLQMDGICPPFEFTRKKLRK
jgi:hypothetical protein